MKRIGEWDVEDHGVDGAQYFPGASTVFTRYDEVETGIGETFNDALEDALEQLATRFDVDDADLEQISKEEKLPEKQNERVTVDTVRDEYREDGDEEEDEDAEDDELNYYVIVRIKWAGDDVEEE
jgi:hypothetical protein